MALVGAGCADKNLGDSPAVDPEAPKIQITTPARGTILGNVGEVQVAGTVTDEGPVESFEINGTRVAVAADGSFAQILQIKPGTTLLHAVAVDADGHQSDETRAVLAGSMEPATDDVYEAIQASISRTAFDNIGAGLDQFLENGEAAALLAPHNPMIDVGAANGEDCLFGKVSIDNLLVDSSSVRLIPEHGGLRLSAVLDGVYVPMHLRYAAACVDGRNDNASMQASRIAISGKISIEAIDGKFQVHLEDPSVSVQGLDLDLGGVPGAVVDLLGLDHLMGPVIGLAMEYFIAPQLDKALGSLGRTRTVAVMGKSIDVNVYPSSIVFDDTGAMVAMDTRFLVAGSEHGPGFLFTHDDAPAMSYAHDFSLAIADDAANQLFGGFWAAGGLDVTVPLDTGAYGTIGQLYDSVELTALLPPTVDSHGKHGLKVVIGDLTATFKLGGQVVTKIAVNGELALGVEATAAGALRLTAGEPAIHVDILGHDDGVEGTNALDSDQLEALISFAATRMTQSVGSLVGEIPLPAFGGTHVADFQNVSQAGYVSIDANITRD